MDINVHKVLLILTVVANFKLCIQILGSNLKIKLKS